MFCEHFYSCMSCENPGVIMSGIISNVNRYIIALLLLLFKALLTSDIIDWNMAGTSSIKENCLVPGSFYVAYVKSS